MPRQRQRQRQKRQADPTILETHPAPDPVHARVPSQKASIFRDSETVRRHKGERERPCVCERESLCVCVFEGVCMRKGERETVCVCV
jgi:hypothetical protein